MKSITVLAIGVFLGLLVFLFWKHPDGNENSDRKNDLPLNHEVVADPTPKGLSSPAGLAASASVPEAKKDPRVEILKEILASRNDNDPRMDTELKVLSEDTKDAMEAYYKTLPHEKRNDLGTIVFLVGRNIHSAKDIQFISSVINEKPCLSLKDCNQAQAPATGEAAHLDSVNETTQSYPELMAVRALVEKVKELKSAGQSSNAALLEDVLNGLRAATRSPNDRVAGAAEMGLKSLSP